MKHAMLFLAAALALAACDSKPSAVAVSARHIEDKVDYPRLTQLADKAMMDKVNVLLAGLEDEERQERADCLKSATADGGTPSLDFYAKTLDVSYLSPRFLSLHGMVESECSTGSFGVQVKRATFDLVKGERVNWVTALKPGVAEDAPRVMALYKTAYRRRQGNSPECLAVLDKLEFTEIAIWLSAEGVMLQPGVDDPQAGCADAVAIATPEIEPLLASAELIAELHNPVPQPASQPASPPQAATPSVQPSINMMSVKDKPDYPRLTGLADKAAMDRINTALAAMEAAERSERKECSHYEKSLDVTYLSPRFLGLKLITNSDCGGAHPNIATVAHTFDLVRGGEVSMRRLLGRRAGVGIGAAGGLRALYKAAYGKQKERAGDAECREAVDGMDSWSLIVWLDRGAGGLGIEPDFPFVVQACADTLTFGAKEVAPYIDDKALLAELEKK